MQKQYKEVLNLILPSSEKTKLAKIQEYYLNENYKALLANEVLKSRILYIDIVAKLVEKDGKRPEYKLYIKPIKWLPEITIKNLWVFYIFCIIHWFIPIINHINFNNNNKKLNITKIKNFILLNRLFHLFFNKWFNFVINDAIWEILKSDSFKDLFEENNIETPTYAELALIINTMEEIKNIWLELPKHHFSKKLSKTKNVEALSLENVFLEIAMKYENKVREHMNFEKTYMKPASYTQDTKQKTDFIWIFSEKESIWKFREIPIQYTISDYDEKKIEWVREYFKKSNLNEMVYLQVFWKIKEKQSDIQKKYRNWINNPDYRENKDINRFPFFINEIEEYTQEAIIMYFYLHYIRKPQKLNFKINGIDFSKTNVKYIKKRNWEIIYVVYYKDEIIWKITLLRKSNNANWK